MKRLNVQDRSVSAKLKGAKTELDPLLCFFNRGDDGVEVGPIAGIELGMEELAIGADFEGAAARRDQGERFDALAQLENFGRQTDGLRRVVSHDAVFDRHFGFHHGLLSGQNATEAARVGQATVAALSERRSWGR